MIQYYITIIQYYITTVVLNHKHETNYGSTSAGFLFIFYVGRRMPTASRKRDAEITQQLLIACVIGRHSALVLGDSGPQLVVTTTLTTAERRKRCNAKSQIGL